MVRSGAPLAVLFPSEGESWQAFIRRVRATPGRVLVITSGRDAELAQNADVRRIFLGNLAECTDVVIATRTSLIAREARQRGLHVIDRGRALRTMLRDHSALPDAVRLFSPHRWQQQLKTHLQRMGLLALPRLRIGALVALSIALFSFVILRLLPSAEIHVYPRKESVSQTANIFLVQTGATVSLSPRVHRMSLIPIVAQARRTLTFDQISKEFTGSSALLPITIVNRSTEPYSLKGGTRFVNQAEMVFRIREPVFLEPGEETTRIAVAEATDVYGKVIGARGNLPSGLRWDIPGLTTEERHLVYGENREEGRGGTSAFRSVLRRDDLDLARKLLEQELLANAKQLIEEEKMLRNTRDADVVLDLLYYPELTHTAYANFVLPTAFVGESVTSVPVEGEIRYTVFAYDSAAILKLLSDELNTHTQEGRELIDGTMTLDRLVTHVIDYADDFSWIKITVDLTGTERYVLDPLSPTGALFGKRVRERVHGLPADEAARIIRNMPEVEDVDISLWPPWNTTLPATPSQIALTAE